MRKFQVIIYGSYGYTGSLIVKECKKIGLRVLLSGRSVDLLNNQSNSTGFPYEAANIDDSRTLEKVLEQGDVVIHCAGPFQHTSHQMVHACLRTRTHYLDISGEYQVFELLQRLDTEAKKYGIIIMPGTGFDVVPTDCLAVHLKQKLPTATHLELAFAMSGGGLSRGTAKTMVEGMGYGSVVRENGEFKRINLGSRTKMIDFGTFRAQAICIPWGDLSTAYRSTKIPNIEVYSAVPKKLILLIRGTRWFNWLLRARWFKNMLLRRIDRRPPGPSEENLEKGRSYIWGRVRDSQGNTVEERLETPSGYKLTAQMSVIIATRILNEERRVGYFTPAEYFGPQLIQCLR